MANTNVHNSPVAVTYAQSLLELATERNQAQPVGQEMAQVAGLLASEPMFREYLADPGVGHVERAAVLKKIFGGRVSELVYNILQVMNNHGRLRLLEEVGSAYGDLLQKQLGNVEVGVTTARKLDANQLEQVRQRVSQALGKNAIVQESVDESIIGGLVVRVGDKLIDASVRQQLSAMRHQLLNAAARVA